MLKLCLAKTENNKNITNKQTKKILNVIKNNDNENKNESDEDININISRHPLSEIINDRILYSMDLAMRLKQQISVGNAWMFDNSDKNK